MGTYSYSIEVGDPQGNRYETCQALVDTGASYSVLPASLLRRLEVEPHTRELFVLADGREMELDVGRTWIRIDGKSEITLFVFGDEGSEALLGAYTLEGLGLGVDPTNQRLIPTRRFLMAVRG